MDAVLGSQIEVVTDSCLCGEVRVLGVESVAVTIPGGLRILRRATVLDGCDDCVGGCQQAASG